MITLMNPVLYLIFNAVSFILWSLAIALIFPLRRSRRTAVVVLLLAVMVSGVAEELLAYLILPNGILFTSPPISTQIFIYLLFIFISLLFLSVIVLISRVIRRRNNPGELSRASLLFMLFPISQYAAFSAAQYGIQRDIRVIEAQNAGDAVDPLQRSDHTQHTAQDRRAAKTLRRAVACPRGQESHHGSVDQGQNLVDKGPDAVEGKVRHRLRDERGETRAQSCADDAGEKGYKDIAYGSQGASDPGFFHG